jgi:hypothetical protein
VPGASAAFDDVKPWPGENPSSNPRAVLGGNRPPPEEAVPLEFREELLREHPDFLTTLEGLVDASGRAVATNDQELGRCGDLVKRYRSVLAHIASAHKTVKEPYLLAGRLVDAEKNTLTEKVEAAKRKVEAIGNTYVAKREAEARAERERVAAEQRAAAERAAAAERDRAEQEAARAAAEATSKEERDAAIDRAADAAREAEEAMAAAALAPAAPGRSEPVRSDEGATVSGKQEWACEVEDFAKAFRAVKSDPKVREAIDAAVKRLVKAGQREIAGVRIWPVAKANFR